MTHDTIEARRNAPRIAVEPRGKRRSSPLKRAVRAVILALEAAVAAILILVPLFAFVDPPVTALMLVKRIGGAPIEKSWTPLSDISPHLARAVLASEDARFCAHHGVDLGELREVLRDIEKGESPRGASTITMQTVKNLFLWPGRSYVRKAVELPLALYADLVWSKRRTMEIYLNIVEWDTGVYGAAAAAEHHFGVAPGKLTASQAARLAAVLPAPEARDPAKPDRRTRSRAATAAARAKLMGPYMECLGL